MASLSTVEQLALWGPPLVMLLITAAYYLRWGKEADEGLEPTRDTGGEA